jgi:hypothetical protein
LKKKGKITKILDKDVGFFRDIDLYWKGRALLPLQSYLDRDKKYEGKTLDWVLSEQSQFLSANMSKRTCKIKNSKKRTNSRTKYNTSARASVEKEFKYLENEYQCQMDCLNKCIDGKYCNSFFHELQYIVNKKKREIKLQMQLQVN